MNSPRLSAGLLMFRVSDGQLEFLLAHPGGPFFAKKDDGAWTIPKGEIASNDEDLLTRARIEFAEEVGLEPIATEWLALGSITQKGGKIVHGWAFAGDLPESFVHRSNSFEFEWPPHSGKVETFPEIDRVAFFSNADAQRKLKAAQLPFLERLVRALEVH